MNGVIDYLAMNGYGGYVWGSFGATALALLLEQALLRARHRQAGGAQ